MKKYIYDSTRDEDGNFVTGYRMSKGRKYITIEYITNWQGGRDKTYRVATTDFISAEDTINRINAGWIEPVKVGEPVR